jgi:hypothetical protein
MSSEDEEEVLEWDMADDSRFTLHAGYKFPQEMSYLQMVAQVNLEVQKVSSDSVRPNIRRYVDIAGCKVPSQVHFYCRHGRSHGNQEGRKPPKNPESKRASRT